MADNWQLKAVISATDKMSPVLKGIGVTARGTRKYLTDMAGSAGRIVGMVGLSSGLFGSLLGGFSIAAVKNAMVGLTDMEDAVNKIVATTGLAATEVRKMQYVAKLSNVPFESLTGSVGKLNKQLFDAANGKNKDLSGLMSKLGISMRDSNGQIRSGVDLLPELADAMQRNENPAVRAKMGMLLFGKSWQEIMPMLADGAEGINKRMARFKELGLEVKDAKLFDKSLKEIGVFGDLMDDLSFVSRGFQNTIAAGLIPALTPLLNGLIKWIVVNKQLVATEISKFVKEFADYLREVDWEEVGRGIKSLIEGAKSFIKFIGGARNALIALAVFMAAPALAAFGGLISAVVSLGVFIAGLSWPVLAVIAAVMALGAAGYWVYENWERISPVFMETFGPLLPVIKEFWETAKGAFGELMILSQDLADLIGPVLMPYLKAMGQGFGVIILGAVLAVVQQVRVFVTLLTYGLKMIKEVASITTSVVMAAGDLFGVNMKSNEIKRPMEYSPGDISAPQQAKVGGEVKVKFEGLPPGVRVETKQGGSIPLNTDVGYRSAAMNMPY
ncbi:MAG: hypothetical protein H6R18_1947 [Proteobacteria bacterium]|nr:hypothetical protein [Pseudomonadota bacterium]